MSKPTVFNIGDEVRVTHLERTTGSRYLPVELIGKTFTVLGIFLPVPDDPTFQDLELLGDASLYMILNEHCQLVKRATGGTGETV